MHPNVQFWPQTLQTFYYSFYWMFPIGIYFRSMHNARWHAELMLLCVHANRARKNVRYESLTKYNLRLRLLLCSMVREFENYKTSRDLSHNAAICLVVHNKNGTAHTATTIRHLTRHNTAKDLVERESFVLVLWLWCACSVCAQTSGIRANAPVAVSLSNDIEHAIIFFFLFLRSANNYGDRGCVVLCAFSVAWMLTTMNLNILFDSIASW